MEEPMRRRFRWMGFTLALLLATAVIGAAAPPEHSTGIDVIWAYAGAWNIEIDRFDTANSKASHEKTLLRNDCWKRISRAADNAIQHPFLKSRQIEWPRSPDRLF